jgi:hypothetical protein
MDEKQKPFSQLFQLNKIFRDLNYLLDEGDDLLDAFTTITGLAQDLDDTISAPRTADRVNRDPRSCRLLLKSNKRRRHLKTSLTTR